MLHELFIQKLKFLSLPVVIVKHKHFFYKRTECLATYVCRLKIINNPFVREPLNFRQLALAYVECQVPPPRDERAARVDKIDYRGSALVIGLEIRKRSSKPFPAKDSPAAAKRSEGAEPHLMTAGGISHLRELHHRARVHPSRN